MKISSAIALSAIVALGFTESSFAQQQKSLKDQLVGTWTLVSAEAAEPDGTKGPLTKGGTQKGLMILTEGGMLSFQVIANDHKVASKSRFKMTPEEMKASAEGVLSYFGSYTVDDADKSITVKIEASSFPNQTEAPAKRMATLNGDELRMNNPGRLAGGQTNLVWKRAK
jgi:Lipocalin-like domain